MEDYPSLKPDAIAKYYAHEKTFIFSWIDSQCFTDPQTNKRVFAFANGLKSLTLRKLDDLFAVTTQRNAPRPDGKPRIFDSGVLTKEYLSSFLEFSQREETPQNSMWTLERFQDNWCGPEERILSPFQDLWAKARNLIGDHTGVNVPELRSDQRIFNEIGFPFDNIKHKSRQYQENMFFKYVAIYLINERNFNIKTILAKLPLTRIQIRNALHNNKKGFYTAEFEDKRGEHKIRKAVASPRMVELVKSMLESEGPFTSLQQLKDAITELHPDTRLAKTTLFRIVKQKLKYKFTTQTKINPGKNTEGNKQYRFWFSYKLASILCSEKICLSIDESSFSFFFKKNKCWKLDEKPKAKAKGNNIGTITLLLACSPSAVEAFYIVKDSIDSMIFLDFMKSILDHCHRRRIAAKTHVVFLMDNAKIHHAKPVKAYLREEKIRTIFVPAYTPELNFIENVFGRIKKKMDEQSVKTA